MNQDHSIIIRELGNVLGSRYRLQYYTSSVGSDCWKILLMGKILRAYFESGVLFFEEGNLKFYIDYKAIHSWELGDPAFDLSKVAEIIKWSNHDEMV